jgi:hypothetical protein
MGHGWAAEGLTSFYKVGMIIIWKQDRLYIRESDQWLEQQTFLVTGFHIQ